MPIILCKTFFKKNVYLLMAVIVAGVFPLQAFGFQQTSAQIESSVFVNFDRDDTFVWQNGERYLCEVGKYYWDCQEGLGNDLQIIDDGTGNNVLVCSTRGTTEPGVVQRSELRIIHYQDYGVSNFSKFSMKMPSDYYIPHRTTIFWQVHQGSGGLNPPLNLAMDGLSNYTIRRSLIDENSTYLFRSYLPKEGWHTYFIEYKLGDVDNGGLRLWMDSKKRMEFEGATANQYPPFYTKFGIYRYSDKRDFVNYFDDAGWSKDTSDPLWDAGQLTEIIPANGLIGQWEFDELNSYDESGVANVYSTVAWDSSGGCSYVGNVRNGITRTPGHVGTAVSLDGIDDYISIPDSEIWDTGSAVTVSCWFKTSVQQSYIGLVSHDDSNYKYLLYLTGNSGDLNFYVRTASGALAAASGHADGYYADGQWHHVAGVYDRYAANGRIKIYVDGVLAGSAAGYDENILAGDEGIYIGRWGGHYFNGQIDEVRIYNYGRSSEEIEAEASQKCIARWTFDTVGAVAGDDFRSNNWLSFLYGTGWTTGFRGSALLFDGINDYAVTFPSRMWDAGQAVTVFCRVKTTVLQNDKNLIVCDKSNPKYLLSLTGNSGILKFDVQTASGISSISVVNTAGYYADNVWHSVVGVYDRYTGDGKRLKLYVDGNLAASGNGYDENIPDSEEGITIAGGIEAYFQGAMDDVSIYRTGLTEDEIQRQLCSYDILCDLNGDCKVDVEDLFILSGNWLLDCTYPNDLTTPECH